MKNHIFVACWRIRYYKMTNSDINGINTVVSCSDWVTRLQQRTRATLESIRPGEFAQVTTLWWTFGEIENSEITKLEIMKSVTKYVEEIYVRMMETNTEMRSYSKILTKTTKFVIYIILGAQKFRVRTGQITGQCKIWPMNVFLKYKLSEWTHYNWLY